MSDEKGELWIHGRCHPGSPTWAVITGRTLTIRCAECNALIIKLLAQLTSGRTLMRRRTRLNPGVDAAPEPGGIVQ